MNNHQQKTILFLLVGILLGTFAATIYFTEKQTRTNSITEENGTKRYKNDRWHYSLEYLNTYLSVKELTDQVTFAATETDAWSFSVLTQPTAAASAQEWLDSEPKGGMSSQGYQVLFLMPMTDGGQMAVIAEYVIVDHDGETPIYGKVIKGLLVKNGVLFQILINLQLTADQVATIPADMMHALISFQVE